MLRHFLTFSVRVIRKNGLYSIINLLGMAVGSCSCLFLTFYIIDELSYDRFFSNSENIYRVTYQLTQKNSRAQFASSLVQAADVLKEEIPEVKQAVKFRHLGRQVVSNNQKDGMDSFEEFNIYHSSPAFFQIFDIPILHGNSHTFLEAPYSAVISSSTSMKYFGTENAIGKVIKIYGDAQEGQEYKVTGVFEDVPDNSHMQVDFLLSLSSFRQEHPNWGWTGWYWYGFYTYLEVDPGISQDQLQAKVNSILKPKVGAGTRYAPEDVSFNVQALTDIHLSSHYSGEIKANNDKRSVLILFVIAVGILIISWGNYLNLTSARSLDRLKEISVKKAFGASRSSLTYQALVESAIVTLVSLILGVFMLITSEQFLSDYIGFDLQSINSVSGWIALISILLIGGAIIGTIPSQAVSHFRIGSMPGGKFQKIAGSSMSRHLLIVVQYSFSLIAIIGAIIISRQVDFLINKDIGIQKEEVLVLKGPKSKGDQFWAELDRFKQMAISLPGVQAFTITSNYAGMGMGLEQFRSPGSNELTVMNGVYIDYDHGKVFANQFIAGRDFERAIGSDSEALIINEKAMSMLGFRTAEEAIGETIGYRSTPKKIIGVVKNHQQTAFEQEASPIVFIPTRFYEADWADEYFALKINPSALSNELLTALEASYESSFPRDPFNYFFLDEAFNKQFQRYVILKRLSILFSSLAVIISAIGLFGLSIHNFNSQKKELGIRKVLGSSNLRLIGRWFQYYAKWIFVAATVAVPGSVFVGKIWLQQFPHQINLSWTYFIVPLLGITLITLVTTLLQLVRTVNLNPVSILRDE